MNGKVASSRVHSIVVVVVVVFAPYIDDILYACILKTSSVISVLLLVSVPVELVLVAAAVVSLAWLKLTPLATANS